MLQAFVIHLERATARRAHVDTLVQASPLKTQVIAAVDGEAEPQRIAEIYPCPSLHKPAYPFALNPGEVGCFLSHRKVWQHIVDGNLDAGLILEDDVAIDPDAFARSFALATKHIGELGYIQFQVRDLPAAPVIAQSDKAQIMRPDITPLRTSAQLVSREAAIRLLALTTQIDRPVDTFLQMHWLTGIHLTCVTPSGVSDLTQALGGSTLHKKKPFSQKLMREFRRFRYRLQLARYSRLKP